jgi:hypothetical protein
MVTSLPFSSMTSVMMFVPVANATCVLSIGDTVGGNATFLNAFSITVASGAGRKYPTTEAGGALVWADVGTENVLQ